MNEPAELTPPPRPQQQPRGTPTWSASAVLPGPPDPPDDQDGLLASAAGHTIVARVFHEMAAALRPQPEGPSWCCAPHQPPSEDGLGARDFQGHRRGDAGQLDELPGNAAAAAAAAAAAEADGFQIRRPPHRHNRFRGNISDQALTELSYWFPELLPKALEAVDETLDWLERPVAERRQAVPPISRVVCRDNPQLFHYQVHGEAPHPYVTTLHFCSCKAFYNSMVSRERTPVCKHQLAVRMVAVYLRDSLPETLLDSREYARVRNSDLNNLNVLDRPLGDS